MSNYAIELAQTILKKHWGDRNTISLPIDVQKIADESQVEVILDSNLPDTISGKYFYKAGKHTCVVNAHHHVNRKRFTLAHELGHYFLKHGDKEDSPDTLYRQNGVVGPDEIEANAFAAELLMPTSIVRHLILEQDVTRVEQLAHYFGVSEVAMRYRLKNLGWAK